MLLLMLVFLWCHWIPPVSSRTLRQQGRRRRQVLEDQDDAIPSSECVPEDVCAMNKSRPDCHGQREPSECEGEGLFTACFWRRQRCVHLSGP